MRVTQKSGKRWVVRYRAGGRYAKLIHAGSFKTQKDARARRDYVISELAAGRDPMAELRKLAQPPALTTVRAIADRWIATFDARRSNATATVNTYRSVLPTAIEGLEEFDPQEVTWRHIDAWVAEHVESHSPGSLGLMRVVQRHIFDYAEVDPNPARDRRIKLPQQSEEEPNPPSAEHLLKILERVPEHHLLPLIVLEQTGMRVGELALTWGDVDEDANRFRLPAEMTKTRRARWVQVPEWLMQAVAETCPREDRVPERRVFPRANPDPLRAAMRRACTLAGIPHYHPHDLRHRRITIWHHENVPWKVVADRVGQAKASVTIDVYSHVLPVTDVPIESYEALLVRAR